MKQEFSRNQPDSNVLRADRACFVRNRDLSLEIISISSGRLRNRWFGVYSRISRSRPLLPTQSKIRIVPLRTRLRIVGVGQNGYADRVQQLLDAKAP